MVASNSYAVSLTTIHSANFTVCDVAMGKKVDTAARTQTLDGRRICHHYMFKCYSILTPKYKY